MRLSNFFRIVMAVAATLALPLRAQEVQLSVPSAAPVEGQHQTETQPTGPPTFKTATNLVVLHVNVLDGRRSATGMLPQTAFRIYEDGVQQAIEFFGTSEMPIAAGLVIDNSTSMVSRRNMVRAGVTAFAESSRDVDQMFTVLFNEHVRYGLPPTVPFTRNQTLLISALSIRAPGGLTAFHDAVIDALGHLSTSSNPKRVLVVLSDGKDNASRASESNMLYRASQSNALIYTIWTGDVAHDRGNPGLLRRLAEGSGGAAYAPKSEQEVVSAFAEVATITRRGYSLGYSPTNSASDGRYRRVSVTVEAPDKRKLTVRTRQGYTAPDDNAQAAEREGGRP